MTTGGAPAVAIDLDGVLADTHALWRDWLASSAPVLEVDVEGLPDDRAEAARALEDGRAGNWRTLLERFAEERAPVYVRREPATGAALRTLAAGGRRIGVFTDAPEQLARVVVSQLGVDRRIDALEAGADALPRLLARIGPDAVIVRTRSELEGAVRGST